MRAMVGDNRPLLRHAIGAILEHEGISVTGAAGDGREAVTLSAQLQPEIVVLDIHLPLLNGMDAAKQILKNSLTTRIILLADEVAAGMFRECLQAGVAGLVLKTAPACELRKAIQAVCRGVVYVSPGVNRAMSKAGAGPDVRSCADRLSLREREVLQLICEGKAVKEIAAILGISQKTAESHRRRINNKLKVSQTAELVRYAVRCGIIQA